MKKIVALLLTSLFLMMSCTAFANFEILNQTSIGAELRIVPYITSFNDNGSKFKFLFKSNGCEAGVLTVKKDKKVIYSNKIPFARYAYMTRIRDVDSGRIFYIIGDTEQRGIIMGYDPQNNKWQKYIDSDAFYCPFVKQFGGINIIDRQKNLRVVLCDGYYDYIYHLFWDQNKNWFEFNTVGLVRK